MQHATPSRDSLRSKPIVLLGTSGEDTAGKANGFRG